MNFKIIYIFLFFLFYSCSDTRDVLYSTGKNLSPLPNQTNFQAYVAGSLSTPTSTPNIFIFLIDTLRPDYVNAKDTPNIHDFLQKYATPKKSLTAATATHHATYGLFFSRPPYERKPIINSGWNSGSIHMQIMKNGLGYAVRPYAAPGSYYCLSSSVSSADVRSENAQMQLLFGTNTSLLSSCNNTPANLLTGSTTAERDSAAVDRFISDLATFSSLTKQFGLVHIESPHPKFSWLSTISDLYTPNFIDTPIREEGAVFRPNHDEIIIMRNSYKNGAKSADYQFGRFIAALKGVSGSYYKNSLVILLSDHGENLYEKSNHFGHGGPPTKEVSEIVLSMKFPGVDDTTDGYYDYLKDVESASIMDVFPTIYESIGMTNYAQTYYMGESLLSHHFENNVVVTPNDRDETPQFALIGKDYKVYGNLIYAKDFMNSSSFEIVKITDLNDFDLKMDLSADELNEKIRSDFYDVLTKMFP